MEDGFRAWRFAGLGLALGLASATPAAAHPHVWVTVKSQIAFTPDGKVAAVVHDWVFDEMYSSFATQGLAPPGELVKREQFAPLAKENAGSLAEIGYFTTLKIGGKAWISARSPTTGCRSAPTIWSSSTSPCR